MNAVDHISVQANVSAANVKGAMAPGRNQSVANTVKSVM